MKREATPSVPHIVLAPELAILTVLDRLLAMLQPTLVAQHPTLVSEQLRARDPPTLRFAHALLRDGRRLRRRLRCYERAVYDSVEHDLQVDEQLPF